MKDNYRWHGEPVNVKFGHCFVKMNKEKPMWWYNYECSLEREDCALIPAIQISQGDQMWVNANHFGIGVNKLLKGGWPDSQHFSLPKEAFEESKSHAFVIREFNELEFATHEAKRNKWQKDNYPDEFAKMESIRKMIVNKHFK